MTNNHSQTVNSNQTVYRYTIDPTAKKCGTLYQAQPTRAVAPEWIMMI